MRYGVCTNMAATDAEGIGTAQVAQAAAIGFDYVEMPLAQMMALEEQPFEDGPLHAIRTAGIPCLCCNNFFPASFRLTGPDADHRMALRYAAKALARAARMGAEKVVFGSGAARNVPDGFPPEQAHGQLVDLLKALGPIAQANGIVLVIEPLNRMESNIINTLREGIILAEAANHPAVAVLVDYYHAGISGDAADGIMEAGKLLQHVHVAQLLGRAMPTIAQANTLAPFFAALHKIGYDATVSVEAVSQGDFVCQVSQSLQTLKQVGD